MDYSISPIRMTAEEVAAAGTNDGVYRWSLEFKLDDDAGIDLADPEFVNTPREAEGFFSPFVLMNVDIVRNYVALSRDHVTCNIEMMPGMWIKIIHPARKNCTVHLTRTRLTRVGGTENNDAAVETWVFKPLFETSAQLDYDQDPVSMNSRRELDLNAPIPIRMDLLDRSYEEARQVEVAGNWRQAKAADVLRGVLAKTAESLDVDGEPAIRGIVFSDKSNEDVREHVIVPQGVKLPKLTEFLHEHCGGLWSTGASTYLQDRFWYCFPPFDTESFHEAEDSLTFVVVPPQYYSEMESTFMTDAGRTTALVASSIKITDNKQALFMNEGDGVRFASATKLNNAWAKTKDNKAVAVRSETNTESRIEDEGNNQHQTRMAAKRITDNSLAEYSRLAARRGNTVMCEWQRADHTLIKPGMRVKVIYQSGDDVEELTGRVIDTHTAVQKMGYGNIQTDYLTTCVVNIFFNFPSKKPT